LTEASRTPGDGTRKRDVVIEGQQCRAMTPLPIDEGEDGAQMTKVRALLGVLTVPVLVAFAAGCGPVSDQNQARQEVKKKVEATGQQVRQEAQEKVEAKKQEVKMRVEALQEKVDDLQKDVEDLKKEVKDLQKKIDAHEQKEQQQQIDQLKKALNDLKKKVDAQEQ
jgi:septal ring factor EnvC (AmiA/AmiB activator)